MRRWLTILLVLVPVFTWCQGPGVRGLEAENRFWVTTPEDSLLAGKVLAGLKDTPGTVAELMVRAGKALEGQPYVAGTLDEAADAGAWKEELRIYLTRTDCIIFVETCLALARTAAEGGDFMMFANEIRQSRYRDGQVGGYADRLHYTTEWGMQGEARGVLKDITKDLGGVPLHHPVNYMTSHPESYPHMDDTDAVLEAERRINDSEQYYIPKTFMADALEGIRTGDIICMVTSVPGLDISHVGMALVEGGTVRLLHASTGPMKVVTESRTLMQYLAARPAVTGIRVLRPL